MKWNKVKMFLVWTLIISLLGIVMLLSICRPYPMHILDFQEYFQTSLITWGVNFKVICLCLFRREWQTNGFLLEKSFFTFIYACSPMTSIECGAVCFRPEVIVWSLYEEILCNLLFLLPFVEYQSLSTMQALSWLRLPRTRS